MTLSTVENFELPILSMGILHSKIHLNYKGGVRESKEVCCEVLSSQLSLYPGNNNLCPVNNNWATGGDNLEECPTEGKKKRVLILT